MTRLVGRLVVELVLVMRVMAARCGRALLCFVQSPGDCARLPFVLGRHSRLRVDDVRGSLCFVDLAFRPATTLAPCEILSPRSGFVVRRASYSSSAHASAWCSAAVARRCSANAAALLASGFGAGWSSLSARAAGEVSAPFFPLRRWFAFASPSTIPISMGAPL